MGRQRDFGEDADGHTGKLLSMRIDPAFFSRCWSFRESGVSSLKSAALSAAFAAALSAALAAAASPVPASPVVADEEDARDPSSILAALRDETLLRDEEVDEAVRGKSGRQGRDAASKGGSSRTDGALARLDRSILEHVVVRPLPLELALGEGEADRLPSVWLLQGPHRLGGRAWGLVERVEEGYGATGLVSS
jgi:hypothetical protein